MSFLLKARTGLTWYSIAAYLFGLVALVPPLSELEGPSSMGQLVAFLPAFGGFFVAGPILLLIDVFLLFVQQAKGREWWKTGVHLLLTGLMYVFYYSFSDGLVLWFKSQEMPGVLGRIVVLLPTVIGYLYLLLGKRAN